MWDAAKPVLQSKFIALSAYIKNGERSQINNVVPTLRNQKNNNKINPNCTHKGNNKHKN